MSEAGMEKGADAQTLPANFFEDCGDFWVMEDYLL